MYRFIRAAMVIALLVAKSAIAFPLIFDPAFLKVAPLLPMPNEHVVIWVYDFAENGILQVVQATNIKITQTGSTIQIDATRLPSRDISVRGPFAVDLGVLAPGRYTVEYSSAHPDDTFNPAFHVATLSFSVSLEGMGTAVEYYNAQLDHYFITAFADEIAKLDSGVIKGWSRTGEAFHVLPADTMPSDANPVCRFYGLPQAGLDSHFYSDDPAECDAVLARWPTQWVEESPAVFGTPNLNVGTDCRALYRLYNNRPDANHRYTVSTQARNQMLAKGWVLEGRYGVGTDAYAMCVPN